jgi:hypothetical protein
VKASIFGIDDDFLKSSIPPIHPIYTETNDFNRHSNNIINNNNNFKNSLNGQPRVNGDKVF